MPKKIKARVKSPGYQIKEKTILDDLTNTHEVCFMMDSAFKVMNTCLWYLDSGCSRHMTTTMMGIPWREEIHHGMLHLGHLAVI